VISLAYPYVIIAVHLCAITLSAEYSQPTDWRPLTNSIHHLFVFYYFVFVFNQYFEAIVNDIRDGNVDMAKFRTVFDKYDKDKSGELDTPKESTLNSQEPCVVKLLVFITQRCCCLLC